MSYEPLPRPEQIRWLVATQRKSRATLISRIRHWVTHWDVSAHRSRKCAGEKCALCHAGLPRQIRYICLAIDSSGNRCLLEFRERHYGLLEHMRNEGGGEVGQVVVVQKMGEAKNSPIDIKVTAKEKVTEQDITRLVESLGLPAKFVSVMVDPFEDAVDRAMSTVAARHQFSDSTHSEVEPT